MTLEYKVGENIFPYYVKLEVFRHIDAFTHVSLRETLLDGLVHLQDKYKVQIHGWMVMFSSLKLIISIPSETIQMEQVVDSLLNYTDKKLMNEISELKNGIKQKWMMQLLESNQRAHGLLFWHSRYTLTPVATPDEFMRRLYEMHESPVRDGIVWDAQQYMYGSAIDYKAGEPGLLPVIKLQGTEDLFY